MPTDARAHPLAAFDPPFTVLAPAEQTAPFVYATARRVTLAGQVFDAPRIGLSRAQSGSSSRSERDGVIGNALLERYVMTVDYRRKLLVLEK